MQSDSEFLIEVLSKAAQTYPDRSLVDLIESALYSEGYKCLDEWLVKLGDREVGEIVSAHYPGVT